MLFDDLKKARMQAMKEHDTLAKDILGIAVNKCMLLGIEKKAKGEELLDADCLQQIQKTIKELDEEIENLTKVSANDEKYIINLENAKKQRDTLLIYLPKQLSEEEIKDIISKLEDKSIPMVMKYFKMNYAGSVDMKLVNKVLKEI